VTGWRWLANGCPAAGVGGIALVPPAAGSGVLVLVLGLLRASAYAYQWVHPLRLSYRGSGGTALLAAAFGISQLGHRRRPVVALAPVCTARSQPLFWHLVSALSGQRSALAEGQRRHQPWWLYCFPFPTRWMIDRGPIGPSAHPRWSALRTSRKAPGLGHCDHRPDPCASQWAAGPVLGGPLAAHCPARRDRPCRPRSLRLIPAGWWRTPRQPGGGISRGLARFLALEVPGLQRGWAWPVAWLVGPCCGAVNTQLVPRADESGIASDEACSGAPFPLSAGPGPLITAEWEATTQSVGWLDWPADGPDGCPLAGRRSGCGTASPLREP